MPDGSSMGSTATEISRLAGLDPFAYERERSAAADALGFRVSMLDQMVKAARVPATPADEGKQGRALDLPEPVPWPDLVNGNELLDALAASLRRHVVIPPHAAHVVAVWIVHTYLVDRLTHSPRLAIQSPEKGSGKTTLLDLIGLLVTRPLPASGITAASMFRIMDAAQPTLLLDEYDTYIKNNEDLRGVLNAGHKRGGQVIRCVGDDSEPRAFPCFGAVAMAGLGALPGTVLDRSIVVRMVRAKKAEKPARILRKDLAAMAVLAQQAARCAADIAGRLDEDPALPDFLGNRSADNWRPLIAIANLAGGEWPRRVIDAAAKLSGQPDAEAASLGVQVLSDIRGIMLDTGALRMPSQTICDNLGQMLDRPWPELRNDQPITPTQLASLLRGFEIRPKDMREGEDGKTVKGYERAALEDAWSRYLPDVDQEARRRDKPP